MTPKQVIKHYGTIAKAVKITGFSRQVFYKWLKQGYIPAESQFALMQESGHHLTIGEPMGKKK